MSLNGTTKPGNGVDKGSLRGFTLIEMAIVLVVIGLVVGGVLAGQSLIEAARVRAQITQIEKYNSAVNTFRGKYSYLPGDIPPVPAAQFGFVTRAGTQGRGNGNGLIEPVDYLTNLSSLQWPFNGEPTLFWRDLSTASLIDQNFVTAQDAEPYSSNPIPYDSVLLFIPLAKISAQSTICVYSYAGYNYFSLSGYTHWSGNGGVDAVDSDGHFYTGVSITALQAYLIDAKIDDAIPTLGNVQATYLGAPSNAISQTPNAATDSATTCYNTATTPGAYSIQFNGGAGVNCALSFRFQ